MGKTVGDAHPSACQFKGMSAILLGMLLRSVSTYGSGTEFPDSATAGEGDLAGFCFYATFYALLEEYF